MTELIEVEEVKYVLGMDPGGTTGVALLRYTDSTAPELIYLHQITDGHRGFWRFFMGAKVREEVAVVSEKWVEGGVKGANHEPLIVEGVQYPIWEDTVFYQQPAMKALVPDAWLKEQNLWTPGHRHQMDALIHAIVWLRNQGHRPTIEALSERAEKPLAEEGEAESKTLSPDSTEAMTPEEGDEFAELIDALNEAMQGLPQEDAEGGQEAAGADGDGEGLEEGEGAGQGRSQAGDSDGPAAGSDPEGGHYRDADGVGHPDPNTKGKRNKRSLNGVFAGFEADSEEGSVLFDESI